MGDPKSGERAATFYTLIGNYPSCLRIRVLATPGSCRFAAERGHREGIDANAYLTDVFKRLPSETNRTVQKLTPKAWATEQAAKGQTVAQAVAASVSVSV